MSVKVVDVSTWQGSINWPNVKKAGYNYAFIRAGYGRVESQKDSWFDTNYKNALAAGVQILPYHMSYATDADGARKEAAAFLAWVKGKSFTRKIVFYDVETSAHQALSADALRKLIDAYSDELQKSGWEVGLYSCLSLINKIGPAWLDENYKVWCAHYADECGYSGNMVAWQYTSTGKISGITGNVDISELYDENIFGGVKALTIPAGTYKQGSTGAGVKAIQQALNLLQDCNISEDSDYGTCTYCAVKRFQRENGLTADGIAGAKTIAKMEEKLA